MTVYSSVTLGEANEHPHPVAADGNARWPNVFFDDVAFSYYRVRVTDAGGSLIYDDDSVPIIGQATDESGAPPPVPVDQNALAKTGDVKLKFLGPLASVDAGWIRMNGQTIGNGASGAPNAGPIYQKLFIHLWDNANNAVCPVIGSGGRGANGLADFNAGKQITLPDMRGRAPFGTAQMGSSSLPIDPPSVTPTSRIAPAYVDTVTAGAEDVVGAWGGDDAIALTTPQIPAHSHGATGVPAEVGPPAVAAKAALQAADHGHPARYNNVDGQSGGRTDRGGINLSNPAGVANYPAYLGKVAPPPASPLLEEDIGHQIGGSGLVAITGNTSLTGGPAGALTGVASGHENMPPFMLFMFLIKL
jgi:microcystin-dependent protein